MAVYVNTNVSCLNGRRYLNNVQNQLTTTYQRLSSGLRINSAKDDAAGLQISSRLTTQINGLNQGNRNSSDGIALAQTVEGAMDEITGMLQKIRTLAVQASNGTNTLDDRKALSKEATALAQDVTVLPADYFRRQEDSDGAGGDSLFSKAAAAKGNELGTLTLQVGANKGDGISFNVNGVKFSQILSMAGLAETDVGRDTGSKTNNVITFSTAAEAQKAIEGMDKMIGAVDAARAGLGAIQNHGRAKHTQ